MTSFKHRWLLAMTILVALLAPAGCTAQDRPESPATEATGRATTVDRVLDDWHAAASVADAERYFGHFASDGVFLGTDTSERWPVAEFRAYADPYFSEGRGWTYVPSERHVMFSSDGDLAWFDEKLTSEKYGRLRGTGVLRRSGGNWKIVHYNMTFTVPNGIAAEVVSLIRSRSGDAPPAR